MAGRQLAVGRTLAGSASQPTPPPPSGPDPTPTFVSAPAVVSKSTTSVTIGFTADQFVQALIVYGLTTSYGTNGPNETSFNYKAHEMTINGLSANTTYHFKVTITNQSALSANSSDVAVTTDAASGGDPNPPPSPTPFDTGYTYTDTVVPTGAGWTDGSDCRSALQALINATPNGTDATHHRRLVFPAGFTWTLSGYVTFEGKSHWTIEGGGVETTYGHTGGAKLKRSGGYAVTDTNGAIFCASYFSSTAGYRATDLRFHALTFEGSSTTYSTTATDIPAYQMGICFRSCDGARVSHCVFDKLFGDGVYISSSQNSATPPPSRNIRIDGNVIKQNNRMGIAIIACDTLIIEDNQFSDIFYACIDFEPNVSGMLTKDATIRRNQFANIWSWGSSYTDGCIKADCQNGLVPLFTGTLSIVDNTFPGRPQSNGGAGNMFAGFYGSGWLKSASLVITGNACSQPQNGPVVRLKNWQGAITIQNNTGFWNGVGNWVQNDGGNSTINQSGNT